MKINYRKLNPGEIIEPGDVLFEGDLNEITQLTPSQFKASLDKARFDQPEFAYGWVNSKLVVSFRHVWRPVGVAGENEYPSSTIIRR